MNQAMKVFLRSFIHDLASLFPDFRRLIADLKKNQLIVLSVSQGWVVLAEVFKSGQNFERKFSSENSSRNIRGSMLWSQFFFCDF
jgi:hypothetical protein